MIGNAHVCEGCGAVYDTIGPYWRCQGSHHVRGWASDRPDNGKDGPPSFCYACSATAEYWVPWPCPLQGREGAL